MKKELAILLSGLTAMIIIFASAFAIGFVGRIHAEERKDNRLENTTFENNTAETVSIPAPESYSVRYREPPFLIGRAVRNQQVF